MDSQVFERTSKVRPPDSEPEASAVDQDRLLPQWIPVVFCASGFSALLYQVVWQRTLFAIFGVSIEAVTTVVTAFLAGLGFGSLLGGRLARGSDRSLLLAFAATELTIGAFGLLSLAFFRWVGAHTLNMSLVSRGVVVSLIVMLPTSLMGVTLPLLVEYVVRRTGNVGRTVGRLYFVNTAGSALAAFAAAVLILGSLGQARSVALAAAVNLLVGLVVLSRAVRRRNGL